MSHTIRLREPWLTAWIDCTPPGMTGNEQPSGDPAHGETGNNEFRYLRAARKFNQPTGLVSGQRVLLRVAVKPGVRLVSARVNDFPVALVFIDGDNQPQVASTDIRSQLQPFNSLQLTFNVPSQAATTSAVTEPPPLQHHADVELTLD